MSKNTVAAGGHSTLVAGTSIKGEILTENDIRIDGFVDGNIECKGKLIIGQEGKVVGTVSCANAEILGTMQGNIDVKDTLVVHATGRMEGDMKTSVLSIEPNAFFNGTCTMEEKQA